MVKTRWRPNPAFKPRLSQLISKAPPQVGSAATQALRTNGEEIVPVMRRAAPRDSGALQESIDWKFGDPPPGVLGVNDARRVQARQDIPEHLRISIFAGGRKAPHAHLVHDGTAERFTDDGKSTGAMPAQPFFFPYIRAYQRRFRNRIRRLTRAALKKALS